MRPWDLVRRPLDSSRSPGSRAERLARLVSLALLAGLLAAVSAAWLGRIRSSDRTIELVARQPAAGGWSLDRIVVNRGERVRLRIRSEDVVHGFAIGRLGVDAGPIEPGKTATVEFVADQAGEFTFYCTMWCDPSHPRMRGTLEVRGPAQALKVVQASASDVALQHLDTPRDAGVVPPAQPSAVRGAALYEDRCVGCHGGRGEGTARAGPIGRRELQEMSPAQVFQMLSKRKNPHESPRMISHVRAPTRGATTGFPHPRYARGWSAQDRWDVVAYLWSLGTTPDRLALGQQLYLKNCAACHGERGVGDGPGGKSQPKKPADFTDLKRMLAGTSDLYTAKIRRGGMGTGMPYWGSIFTEQELAALIDYLWSFSLGR